MSSNFAAMNEAIRNRFKVEVTTVKKLPTHYDNQEFKDKPENKIWCRLAVVHGESNQRELGPVASRNFRSVGIMTAMLFFPLNKGEKALMEMADFIADQFTGITDAGVTYRAPSVSRVSRAGNWWQVNVTVPFFSDRLG